MEILLRYVSLPALLGALVALLLLVACEGCGGGETPSIKQNPGTSVLRTETRLSGTNAVYVYLNENGEDLDVTGKMVDELVEQMLGEAGIKVSNSDMKADLVITGVIKLQVKKRDNRLGIDDFTYAAQAAFRLLYAGSHREISVHEVTAEGRGYGRGEAITNTFTELSRNITSEILPSLKTLLGQK